MTWRTLAEWMAFQCVWLACALGAANGVSAPGIITAMAFVAGILASRRWRPADCLIVITSGLAGLVLESGLHRAGLVRYDTPWPSPDFAPAWMIALWLAFGATIPLLTRLLGKRPTAKATVLGLLTGPAAYWAGERIGALKTGENAATTYVVMALAWSIVLPALLALFRHVSPDAED